MTNLKYFKSALLALLLTVSLAVPVKAEEEPKPEVGIYERLGETIPSGIILNDEKGQPVDVKSLITKPTIFSLVYFRCPGICSPLLNGLMTVVDKTDLEPGKDFDIITISFDQSEDHELASGKKESYLTSLDRKIPDNSWRFLTGDSLNIRKISDELGFKFARQGNDFMHGAAIMMVSKDGKIIRYLNGTDFLPFDLKMAVTEASEGRPVPAINKLMKMCFSYDPDGRKYALNVTRISAIGTLVLLGLFFGLVVLKKKKNNKTNNNSLNNG